MHGLQIRDRHLLVQTERLAVGHDAPVRLATATADRSSVIWGGNPALQGGEETLSSLVVSGW